MCLSISNHFACFKPWKWHSRRSRTTLSSSWKYTTNETDYATNLTIIPAAGTTNPNARSSSTYLSAISHFDDATIPKTNNPTGSKTSHSTDFSTNKPASSRANSSAGHCANISTNSRSGNSARSWNGKPSDYGNHSAAHVANDTTNSSPAKFTTISKCRISLPTSVSSISATSADHFATVDTTVFQLLWTMQRLVHATMPSAEAVHSPVHAIMR